MKTTKYGRYLTTVPAFTWWLFDKIEERRKKARNNVDSIEKLERLYQLKEQNVISEEDFQELKEMLKKHF